MLSTVVSRAERSLRLSRSPRLSRSLWSEPRERRRGYEVVRPGLVSRRRAVPDHVDKPEYWASGQPAAAPRRPHINTPRQAAALAATSALAAAILHSLRDFIKEGVTTDEIDGFVHAECVRHSAYPSPLNYRGFPKSVCTSVNNVACHGVPDDRSLVPGDLLNVDVTVYREGVHGDCSGMFCVGEVDEAGRKLSAVCLTALHAAIALCRPGTPFSALGKVIEETAREGGVTVVPCFTGHGVGSYFHGPPDVYHFERRGCSEGAMEAGMAFTIEPVLGEGSAAVEVLDDGWTAATEDGSRTAQWEHTVLVTADSHLVLTAPPGATATSDSYYSLFQTQKVPI